MARKYAVTNDDAPQEPYKGKAILDAILSPREQVILLHCALTIPGFPGSMTAEIDTAKVAERLELQNKRSINNALGVIRKKISQFHESERAKGDGNGGDDSEGDDHENSDGQAKAKAGKGNKVQRKTFLSDPVAKDDDDGTEDENPTPKKRSRGLIMTALSRTPKRKGASALAKAKEIKKAADNGGLLAVEPATSVFGHESAHFALREDLQEIAKQSLALLGDGEEMPFVKEEQGVDETRVGDV